MDRDLVERIGLGPRMKVLILDNYDSFVYNLYQAIGELGAEPVVHRNHKVTHGEIRSLAPDAIVLSPVPAIPRMRGTLVCVRTSSAN